MLTTNYMSPSSLYELFLHGPHSTRVTVSRGLASFTLTGQAAAEYLSSDLKGGWMLVEWMNEYSDGVMKIRSGWLRYAHSSEATDLTMETSITFNTLESMSRLLERITSHFATAIMQLSTIQ